MEKSEHIPLVENGKCKQTNKESGYESSISDLGKTSSSQTSTEGRELELSDGDILSNNFTYIQGLAHFLKANMVSGYLIIPFAVKYAGLWAGSIGVFVLTMLYLNSTLTLVESCQVLCKKFKYDRLTYSEAFEISLAIGPRFLQSKAVLGRILVRTTLFLFYSGCCMVYISLLSSYSKQLLDQSDLPKADIRVYVVAWTVLFIPIFAVDNLEVLVPFSVVGNMASLVAAVLAVQYMVRDLPPINSRPGFTSFTGVIAFIGNGIFVIEGMGMILPLENRMKRPKEYGGPLGVASVGIYITGIIYVSFGFIGYLKFGDALEGSLVLNLPNDEWLYMLVKILSLINVYISMRINMYVPTRAIWDSLQVYMTPGTLRHKYGEYIVRYAELIFFCIITLLVPQLNLLIPVAGAVCGSVVTFVLPPLMRIIITQSKFIEDNRSKSKKILLIIYDSFFFLIGIFFFFAGSTVALIQLVQQRNIT